jgi:hypothetical protein
MASSPTTEKVIPYALLGMTAVTGLVDAVSFCGMTFILRLANFRLADNQGCQSTGVGLDETTRAVKHHGNDYWRKPTSVLPRKNELRSHVR